MTTNQDSFLIKILWLCSFNINSKSTHNVMATLNTYEKFYKNNDREGMNIGIPSCIVERYLIDGKNFRHEVYDEGIMSRKKKIPISEKYDRSIFGLKKEVKEEILSQLKADLNFLYRNDIINYRVVLLVTKDEKRKQSLLSNRPSKSEVDSKMKYLMDGCVLL